MTRVCRSGIPGRSRRNLPASIKSAKVPPGGNTYSIHLTTILEEGLMSPSHWLLLAEVNATISLAHHFIGPFSLHDRTSHLLPLFPAVSVHDRFTTFTRTPGCPLFQLNCALAVYSSHHVHVLTSPAAFSDASCYLLSVSTDYFVTHCTRWPFQTLFVRISVSL